jgi:hypothetical protein
VKKSIRTLVLSAVVVFSAAPMFANPMGTNPHPQASSSLSFGDCLNIFLSVTGY